MAFAASKCWATRQSNEFSVAANSPDRCVYRERKDQDEPLLETLESWLSSTTLAPRTVNLLEENGVYTVMQLAHQDPLRLLQLHTYGPDALTQCQRLVERACAVTRRLEEARAAGAALRLE